MGRYRLVVFDLDGTLIDSTGDIAAALDHALTTLGYSPYTKENLTLEISGGLRSLLCSLGVDAKDLAPAMGLYRSFYGQNPIGRTQLYPGAREALDALDSIPLAVATNKAGDLARRILAELELAHHFVAIVGADDVGRAKPDPYMLHSVCERAGVAAEQVLYVGDSPVDAATASAAGVDFCLVAYDGGESGSSARVLARYRVNDLRDIVPLVMEDGGDGADGDRAGQRVNAWIG